MSLSNTESLSPRDRAINEMRQKLNQLRSVSHTLTAADCGTELNIENVNDEIIGHYAEFIASEIFGETLRVHGQALDLLTDSYRSIAYNVATEAIEMMCAELNKIGIPKQITAAADSAVTAKLLVKGQ